MSRKYEVFGEISSKVKGEKPILVGGSAVEFYTQGAYKSLDLDVIAKQGALEPVLKSMGFKKSGRHWYTEDVSLEIVSSYTKLRTKNMKIGESEMRIISVEDIIVDRLNACKHWDSSLDCEQATYLLAGYWDVSDRDYLRKRAGEEKVLDTLEDFLEEVEGIN
ncbi:MAG: hypothetical protein ACE5J5_06505 [Candidatus Hydrothermarchaeales archaeon]